MCSKMVEQELCNGDYKIFDDDDLVISGVAGKFPDSNDVYQFRDNLFNKVDLVSDDYRRWKPIYGEVPQRTGKLFDIEKCDIGYFGFTARQCNNMDPTIRMLLEKVVEAIMDAGYHPSEFKNTNTAICVGTCSSETEKVLFYNNSQCTGDAIIGCERSQVARRLSYFLELNNRNLVGDTACSSSMYAFENAYSLIKHGKCDKAIVCGANLCLHPFVSLQFMRLGVLSADGICKSFDDSGDGYARSEGIVVLILEKAKDAKRAYAKIVHTQTNCDGFKKEGITYPSSDLQKALMKDFYSKCKVDPLTLTYIEAHGTGTKVGDPEEIKTLDEIFCKGRKTPLHIGAVKCNIGHNEPSSALSSVVKIILAMETGYIPPNINYTIPRKGCEALEKGRLKVVTEKMPLPDNRGLFGVNNFGFGGANGHILLEWNPKSKKNSGQPEDNLPRLICVSSRVQEGISKILDDYSRRKMDAEYAYVIQEAFKKRDNDHTHRGYGLYSNRGEIRRSLKQFDMNRPKLYFVLSNFDQEWLKIGEKLMEVPVFAETIQSIHNILFEAANVKLLEIIKKPDDGNLFSQILGTVSIQIGLANVLKVMKVQPDRIIGIGSGEITAAYIDNYLSLKQTILGLFYMVLSITKSSNEKTKEMLEKILPSGTNLYEKWIPKDEHELCKNCAEYFFKNLNSFTNGKDTKRFLNDDSIGLIIGGNIKEISKNNLKLIDANSEDFIVDFMTNLGSLYEYGYDLELSKLYPKISLPVSRGTPMISPLIKWNHDRDCMVHLYKHEDEKTSGHKIIPIIPKTEDWNFVRGHIIDGRNLFPATGYLLLAMETYGSCVGKTISEMRLVFEDVKYIKAANVPKNGSLDLVVVLQTITGRFEIAERGSAVATGRVYEISDEQAPIEIEEVTFEDDEIYMTEKDVYQQLRIRGYHYGGKFKGIKKLDPYVTKAMVEWDGNWVSYMDTILQLFMLLSDTTNLYVPTSIQHLVVNAPRHIELAAKFNNMIPTRIYEDMNIIRSGGIELRCLGPSVIPRRKGGEPVLEVYKFLPNKLSCKFEESVRALIQIILENSNTFKVKVVEVAQEMVDENDVLCPMIQKALSDLPLIQQDLTILSKLLVEYPKISVANKSLSTESNCLILVVPKLLETTEISVALNVIHEAKGFIISRECLKADLSKFHNSPLQILCTHDTEEETLVLLKPISRSDSGIITLDISDFSNEFDWLPKLQNLLMQHQKVIIYSQNSECNGILGFANCLRRESYAEKIISVFIMGEAPKFDPNLDFYKKQLVKNLFINVWKDGVWGTYRHLLLPQAEMIQKEHSYVNVTKAGDLSSLTWLEGRLNTDSSITHQEELVHVYYSALNFRDLMTSSGKLTPDMITKDRIAQECVQGLEYSGRDSKGRRVMGISASASLASVAVCNKQCLYEVPDDWSLEDASTVLVVYGTVLQVLAFKEDPKPGQSILIHSGTGGIGLAAINLSLYYQLNIFVTVGTEEKRKFIRTHYPHIKEEHIGNSRDLSFETMVHKFTNGRGVDYVINSLAEVKLLASVRCLAKGGHFLEIGKYDLANNNALATQLLEKECSFTGFSFDKFLFETRTNNLHKFTVKLKYLLKVGAMKPLPRTVFEYNQVEEAYRYMGTGNHIGKILIKIRDEEEERIYLVPKSLFPAVPRFYCKPNCSYVILGGLGGFGLELADMFVIRGAKKLVLTSKSGVCNGYQLYRMKMWKSYGVSVLTSTIDASTKEGCTKLLNIATELGQVDGIFNLAAVLRDGLFENQTVDNFKTSLAPKAFATQYLDEISRKLCPELSYFVVFSSASCGHGNNGQTNYGMANSIMERICEKRKREGYPGLAIEWGAIGEVGMVAKMQEDNRELVIGGTLQQRISSCLQMMDTLLKQDEPIVSSMIVSEKKYGISGSNLFDSVLNIMGITNLKTISMHSTFPEIGMDSMTAVEIKQTLEREYEVFLTAQDIKAMTLSKLQDLSDTQENSTIDSASVAKDAVPLDIKLLLYHMGTEEHGNTPIIRMKSLVEENEEAPYIVALPGIEGMATILEALAKNLKAHVSCLQYCSENREETLEDTALSLLPHMESIKGDIILLAYSFGCAIAVELLRHLESNCRKIKKVIFIDGSPDILTKFAKSYFSSDDEDVFQTTLLCIIMMQYMPYGFIVQHEKTILSCKTFNDKINYMISISPKVDISKKYITNMCTAAYHKVSALCKYVPGKFDLKSTLTLFKPKQTSFLVNAEYDYGLSNFFQKSIDVVRVEGNHVSMLANEDLANAINKILENLN